MSVPVQSGQYPGGNGSPIYTFYANLGKTLPVIDGATAYGITANGVVDDGPQFRAALTELYNAGGGGLKLPPGIMSCSAGANAENGSFLACGFLPPHVWIQGAGVGATVIQMAPNTIQGTTAPKLLMNWHIQSGGDEDITLSDLTLDGNSANQTVTTNGCRGLHVMRMRHLRVHRVRMINMAGTDGGSSESTATTVDFCDLCEYVDCEVYGASGSPISDTGFAANFSNHINYIGCTARGMGGGGWTESYCKEMLHVNCFSFSNGQYGFNAEQPQGTRYVNCTAGGSASLRTTWGYNEGQVLGNASHGFVILGGTDTLGNPQFAPTLVGSGSGGTLAAGTWYVAFTYVTSGGETQVGPTANVVLAGSTSSIAVTIPPLPPDAATGWNIYASQAPGSLTLLKSNGVVQTALTYTITAAPTGAAVPGSNTATYTITVDALYQNCVSSYNGGSGLNMSTLTSGFSRCLWVGGELLGNASYGISGGAGDQFTLIGHPQIAGNKPANIRSGGMDHDAYGSLMTPGPTVPASGTELLNPYMIPVLVYINGGTLTTPFVQIGKAGAEVQVAAGSNVAIPLAPGEYIKLTYSAAPTWTWVSAL